MPRQHTAPRMEVWVVRSVDEARGVLVLVSPDDGSRTREFPLSEWGGARAPAVGRVVRSFVSVEPDDERLRLAQWVRRLREWCDAARSLTPGLARQALASDSPELAAFFEQPRPVVEFKTVLALVARSDGRGSQAHWVYADDWRWHRARTARAFERLLDLPPGEVVPEPPLAEEPLVTYADRCNERARQLGLSKRLFLVGPAGDDHVFLALEPYQFHQLVYRGLVVPG